MLRSGRLTGTRGILKGGLYMDLTNTVVGGEWYMYIKPSEQKEAQAMLRGEIPILLDPREMINWMKDPNRDERPSPQDVALAHTMCIARGNQVKVTSRYFTLALRYRRRGINSAFSRKCDLSHPFPIK